MKTQKTLLVGLGTTVGAVVFVVLQLQAGVRETLGALWGVSIPVWLVFCGLSLVNFSLYTLRWQLLLKAIAPDHPVRFRRLFWHRMSGFATGYLTPAAQVSGEPIRVALAHLDGVPTAPATGAVVLDLAWEILTFFLYVSVGIVLAVSQGLAVLAVFYWPLWFLGAAFVIGAGLFFLLIFVPGATEKLWRAFHLRKTHRLGQLHAWLSDVEKQMRQVVIASPGLFAACAGLSLVTTTFRALEVLFLAWGFGVTATFSQAILGSTLPGIALFLPIPGGLGVFEGAAEAVFHMIALGIPALPFILLLRLRDALFVALGLGHMAREAPQMIRVWRQGS